MNIKILVAQHKEATLPQDNSFLPVQVGKANSPVKLSIQGDDEGDNISGKNNSFCELTSLYWAWKNYKTDIIGLCHYRRYFAFNKGFFSREAYTINPQQIDLCKVPVNKVEHILQKYDIILAKPRVYPFSLATKYKMEHISEDLVIVENIIKNQHPDYYEAYNKYMNRNNKLYSYNMFMCRYDLLDKYCEWLFKILFEAEKKIKLSPYPVQQRVFGYLSERLLGVFCLKHNLKIKELPIYFLSESNAVEPNYIRYSFRKIKLTLIFYILNFKIIFK